MHEAALGVARLRPGVREQQKHARKRGFRHGAEHDPRIIVPEAEKGRQWRVRLLPFRHQPAEQRGDAVGIDLARDQRGLRVGGDLGERVFTTAEADLERDRRRAAQPSERIGGVEAKARQSFGEQTRLARAQGMAVLAAIEPRRRFFDPARTSLRVQPLSARKRRGEPGRDRFAPR